VYDLHSTKSIWSDDFDIVSHEPPYDPSELPFVSEESFEVLFPKNDKYKEALAQHQDKEVGDVKLLKRGESIKQEEGEQVFKNTMDVIPPYEPFNEDILYPEYLEGSLVLVWDKRRGLPSFDPKDEVLWAGPCVVKEKKNNLYTLSTLAGRKMPCGFATSHLCPYIDGT
jgi:hypothetical protein